VIVFYDSKKDKLCLFSKGDDIFADALILDYGTYVEYYSEDYFNKNMVKQLTLLGSL
jgi:hypothetical protein